MSWFTARVRGAADEAHRRVAAAESALTRVASEAEQTATRVAAGAREKCADQAFARVEASSHHTANRVAAVKNLSPRARAKEIARPGGMFVAGAGTGFVSGHLGLPIATSCRVR